MTAKPPNGAWNNVYPLPSEYEGSTPPHDVDAEQCVVGAMMLSADTIATVSAATARRSVALAELGGAPAEVARRAGHSIAVLFRFYAKALHGEQDKANARIEQALEEGARD